MKAYVETLIGKIVVAQSFLDLEVIIVDGDSTDSTASILHWHIEKYSNVIVMHQSNGRNAEARNTGITHARGNYVSFMDSEDLLHPDMIANVPKRICSKSIKMPRCSI